MKTRSDPDLPAGERAAFQPLAPTSGADARLPSVLILLAAGKSSRMNSAKKEFLPLGRGTVLSECAGRALKAEKFSQVIVAAPKGAKRDAEAALKKGDVPALLSRTPLTFCEGGGTRSQSVFNALKAVRETKCVVLIHDGARAEATPDLIRRVLSAARKYGAACPGVIPVDTQKVRAEDGTILTHLDRASVRAVQTPQGFLFPEILECYRLADARGMECTDDSEVWDSFPEVTGGRRVMLTEGSVENKKITFPSDIKAYGPEKILRVGLGEDFHVLSKGRALMIGGVRIPSDRGEKAHSDGDALLHAIGDALLGAARLGDIGSYFPDGDDRWKGAASSALLKIVACDVRAAGWSIENIDCVVEIERPMLLPYRDEIINSISGILETGTESVFVKAKTNEKKGDVGRGRAIRAFCVCLLSKAPL